MYEVPKVVWDAAFRSPLIETDEIARRAAAAEVQKQIDELTALLAGYEGDTVGMKFARVGLRGAIDHLRIRLAEVAAA